MGSRSILPFGQVRSALSGWRATETERTRESCKRPSRMFAQFLLWIKNFTHKLHSLFYWTQVQSLPCQFVKIDKWISLLFYEFAIVVIWICLNCYMYMSNLFYVCIFCPLPSSSLNKISKHFEASAFVN